MREWARFAGRVVLLLASIEAAADSVADGAEQSEAAVIATLRPPEHPKPDWPSNSEGLVFRWEAADKPGLAYDGSGSAIYAYELTPRGCARYRHDYAMALQGGSFVAEHVGPYLLGACRASNAVTIEVTVTPAAASPDQVAPILSFSGDGNLHNLALSQVKSDLILFLRTSAHEGHHTVKLCALAEGRPNHIVVGYKPGLLACYRDGESVLRSGVGGSLANWQGLRLVFGADIGVEWAGVLEGVAIYARFLAADEAERNYRNYTWRLERRPPVARLEVVGKLVSCSPVPTYREVAPYFRALAVYEYEVERVVAGGYGHKSIRVAHWGMVDRKALPIGRRKKGQSYSLRLEPFDANRQLEHEFLSDALPEDLELPLYYDVGAVQK